MRALVLFPVTALAVWLGAIGTGRAEGYRAVALVCPAGLDPSACDEAVAVDVAAQPVAMITECAAVGQVLATRLSLAPGERHKVVCERRKG